MKEFVLENGEVMSIRPLTSFVMESASRQLAKEGIVMRSDSTLHENLDLHAEVIRQVLVSWKLPDGSEPLLNLRPAKARELILSTPGIDGVFDAAKDLAAKAAAGRKIDLGN